MKTFFAILLCWVFAAWHDTHAGEQMVGQCVYPTVDTEAIQVKMNTTDERGIPTILRQTSYMVGVESNGYIGLWTVPDYDAPDPYARASQFVGFVRPIFFEVIAMRNCT